jgi:hypothetical protein
MSSACATLAVTTLGRAHGNNATNGIEPSGAQGSGLQTTRKGETMLEFWLRSSNREHISTERVSL